MTMTWRNSTGDDDLRSRFWRRWQDELRHVPHAWAATVSSPSLAVARHTFRCEPPSSGQLHRLAVLVADAPPAPVPAKWLGGAREYAGVRAQLGAGCDLVVVSDGLLARYSSVDGTPESFFHDAGRQIERLLLHHLSHNPGGCTRSTGSETLPTTAARTQRR